MFKASLGLLVLGLSLNANAALKAVNMNHTKDSANNMKPIINIQGVNVVGKLGKAKVIVNNFRPNMTRKLNIVTVTAIGPKGYYGVEKIMHCGSAANKKVKQITYVKPGFAYEYLQYIVKKPQTNKPCLKMEKLLNRHKRNGGQAVDTVWIRGVLSLAGIVYQ